MLERILERVWLILAGVSLLGGIVITNLGAPALTELEEITEAIIASEESYRSQTGEYWQAFPSHSVIPRDGVRTITDGLYSAPSRQKKNPKELVVLPDMLPFVFWVSTYRTADDMGYIITFRKEELGQQYQMATAVGPLKGQYSYSWVKVSSTTINKKP